MPPAPDTPERQRPRAHRRSILVRRMVAMAIVCAALTPLPVAAQEVVKLPPFIVKEPLLGPQWRIARVDRFEVLSRSKDRKARAMVEAYRAAFPKLEVLLPPRFLAAFDEPIKLIIYDENLWPVSTQEAVAAMLADISDRVPEADLPSNDETHFDRMRAPWLTSQPVHAPHERSTPIPAEAQVRPSVFFTDMRLTDLDEVVIFSLAPAGTDHRFKISLRSTLVAHLMGKRTPSLPRWFLRGFLEVYREVQFDNFGLRLPPLELATASETRAARRDATVMTKDFVPLLTLLSDAGEPTDYFNRDRQLGLLVRWALDPKGGNQPEALWTLVDDACRKPVDAAMLHRAFQQSAAELEKTLVDYAPTALRESVRWPQPELPAADITFERATSVDVARIKGNWERLETDWVRHNHRELEANYAEKARETLWRGGRRGDRDPQLLVVRALFELESGDTAAAITLLETAAAANAPLRPRAYLELARLQFERWQTDNAGTDTALTAATAAPWLDWLRLASRGSPQMLPVFHTYLDILAVRQAPWDEADRRFLSEGAAAFRSDARLSPY